MMYVHRDYNTQLQDINQHLDSGWKLIQNWAAAYCVGEATVILAQHPVNRLSVNILCLDDAWYLHH